MLIFKINLAKVLFCFFGGGGGTVISSPHMPASSVQLKCF